MFESKFYRLEFQHVSHEKNQAADALAKMESTRSTVPYGVFIQDLLKQSIKQSAQPKDAPKDAPKDDSGDVIMIEPEP